MKNFKILLILCCAAFAGCSKSNDGSPAPVNNDDSAVSGAIPGAYVVKGKKGADFNVNNTNGAWNTDIINLKSHWFYTWGNNIPLAQAPQNCEYVPMFWGKADVTDNNIANVIQLKKQGKISAVLGFNEPDLGDQSNMSVQDALTAWPKLETIGLPLGSPATSWPTSQWAYDFLDKAIAQKRRVDFICVHMYVGTDDVSFIQVLKDLHAKYNKPIWVTEFATADWSAPTMAQNHYTPAVVLAFMQRLLPQLEALDYVQRYSWFSGDPKSAALWSSALVDANGNLTALGKWYAAYKPNADVKK